MNKIIRVCFLLTSCFFVVESWAQPTMSAPTVSGITHNSAVLGGTIAGSGITARGTAWKTSSPVVATDNQLAEGGTSAGTYTHTRSSLPSGTQIFFVAYGTNAGGPAISSESSFYTLSAPPSGQPATFTSSAVSSSQINLSWSIVTATGFLIYRKSGSTAPDVTVDFINGTIPPTTLTDGSALINAPSPFSTGTSFNNTTGLTPGTQYSYSIVPFTYNGTNSETYNYLTASAQTTTAFTFSVAPSGQPATFTATTASSSQINLAWSSVTATGYLIYRRVGGTAPNVTVDLSNGAAPPTSLADGSTLVNGPSPFSTGTSFNNTTGLSSGTQYSYTIVPFGYDGTNIGTYNYLTASAKIANAFTFAAAPSGQPATFTATTASSSQINLAWSSVTATGYLIYRRAGGTAPNVTTDLSNGAAPPTSLADGSTLVNGPSPFSTGTSFNNTTGLSTGSQYSYTIVPFSFDGTNIGTYNYLTASAKTANAFTLAAAPSGQPATFTATTASSSQINLTWSSVTATGYLIYRRAGGTAPNVTVDLSNGAAPPTSLADGSTLVNGPSPFSTGTSFNNTTGLSSGTQYSYTIVPFGFDGTNNQTYNYLTAAARTTNATTFSNTSTIALNGGTTTNIDYINFPTVGGTLINSGGSTNSVSLGKFRISDAGGDGASTTLTSVTFSLANNANVSEIAIFDTGNNNRGQVTNPGTSVSFNSLTGITANDNNNADFEIFATFNTTVVDQQLITLAITAVTTTGSGVSSFAAATTAGASDNKIRVSSNQFQFKVGGIPVTVLANAAPNTNFGPLTVTAVDANGNVQLNRVNTVTLSLFAGTGTLNGVPGLVQNLVAGTTTFNNLSITAAGAKTIRATYGIGGVSAGNININITTPGVLVTAGTVATMCYSGDYQPVSPITIEERDPSDFTTGGTFSLALPSGFEFNQSITSAPTISGNEINTISALSYPSANTVQFSYNISGTSNSTLDRIIISGLQVNYTGTTPATGNLVRFGGTAIQAGNASSDARNHCTLTSAPSATVVSFGVQALVGDPAVLVDQDRFSVTAADVQLVGTPAGGVFTGSAVTFSVANGYRFSPSSVGVGTYNISYTYTEPIAPRCKITVTRTFTVVANIITNLFSSYCTTSPASTNLSISPATVNQIGAIYTLFFGWTLTFQEFVYRDNLSGTDLPLPQVASQYVFDPSDPIYDYNIKNSGNVRIGVKVVNQFGFAFVVQYVNVRVFIAPKLTFDLPASICSNAASINLIPLVTPAPANFATDKFTGTGVTNPSVSVASFDPSTVPGGSTNPTPVNIQYQYKDPNPATGGCSNIIIKQITVNPVPTAPTLASTNSPISVCQGSLATPLTATPASGTAYKWYSNVALGATNLLATGNNFTPNNIPLNGNTFNNAIQNIYEFYLTQTINGCEGPSTAVQAEVVGGPTLTIASPTTAICDTQDVEISQADVGATLGGGATQATWSGGTGIYAGGNRNIFAPNIATIYTPSAAEKLAGTVTLTLTTNNPNPACAPASKTYQVTINKTPSEPGSSNPLNLTTSDLFEYCGNFGSSDGNTIPNSISVTGANVTWYSDIGLTTQAGSTSALPFNPLTRDITYYVTQKANGCESPPRTVRVLIHPVPTPTNVTISNVCLGDLTSFNPIVPALSGPSAPYSITSYNWNLGQGTSSSPNPTFQYNQIGFYNYSLRLITNKGCVGSFTPTIFLEIGPKPLADFKFDFLCIGDSTRFTSLPGSVFDNTSDGRKIKTYAWSFGEPSSGANNLSAKTVPKHKYATSGKYSNASLTITSELGCTASKTQEVYILPYLKNVTDFPYAENFELNDGGWAGAGTNTSNTNPVWSYGTPNGTNINATNGSTKSWYTSKVGISYDKDLRATLNMPCIDVTKLPRPVLSFDFFNDTKQGSDGVYLDASIDGGITWNRAGNLQQGIEWYNASQVAGLSVSASGQYSGIGQNVSQLGWSKSNTGWTSSAFALDNPSFNYSTVTKLRLRFVFGTDPAPKFLNLDGFAIDNVRLSSRNRILLIETFTNENTPRYANNNIGFKSLNSEVSKVQYHANFPAPDSQSGANLQDNSARLSFYGINSNSNGPQNLIPRSYIDGGTESAAANNPTFDFADLTANSWWNTYRSNRGLAVSPFDIAISNPAAPNNNQISVKLTITATSPIPTNRRLNAFIALVEQVDANNTFVMRKMVPNASGIPLTTPITLGQVINTPVFTFDVPKSNPNQLGLVAWIQEIDNQKEVLQSKMLSSLTNPPTVITATEPDQPTNLSFYPIPADKELVVSLPEVATQNTPLVMFDAVGKSVHQTAIDKGQQSKTISTQEFAPGVYLIQLETDKGIVRKKVMVVH